MEKNQPQKLQRLMIRPIVSEPFPIVGKFALSLTLYILTFLILFL